MIELFIATVDYERVCPEIAHLRLSFRETCLRMWRHLGFNPVLLMADCDNFEWQRRRRMLADDLAKGPSYLSTSDDCLPDAAILGVRIPPKYEDFAILSAKPYNEKIEKWTPADYQPFEDEMLEEHFSVGHIAFIRKGCMKEWPPMQEGHPGYDSIQCEYLRSQGWRVGFLKGLGMTHLGKGLSSVWR